MLPSVSFPPQRLLQFQTKQTAPHCQIERSKSAQRIRRILVHFRSRPFWVFSSIYLLKTIDNHLAPRCILTLGRRHIRRMRYPVGLIVALMSS